MPHDQRDEHRGASRRLPLAEGGPVIAGVSVAEEEVVVFLDHHPELRTRGGVLFVPEARVLVVRGKRKLRAFSSECPHKPQKHYKIFAERGRREEKPCFQCGAHGWRWNHRGRALGKAKRGLSRLDLEERDDRVIVRRR